MNKPTNFKPRRKLVSGGLYVLDPHDKSFFFGSYKGHSKKLKSLWNNLPIHTTTSNNQITHEIVGRCMGTFNKYRKRKGT